MAKANDSPTGGSENENTSVYSASTSDYWRTEFTDAYWLDMYNREGLASKACDKYVGDLTSNNYTTNSKLFDKVREDLKFDDKFQYATERAYLVGESLIYLGFNDPGDYADAYQGKQVPDFLKVVPKTWVKLDDEQKMVINEDDCYELYRANGTDTFPVHKSRFVHIYIRRDLQSSLLPAYRPLFVCDNVLWSTGQAYFRAAAGMTHITVKDPKIMKRVKKGRTVTEIDALREEGVFKNINSESVFISDDRYKLELKGVQGSSLNPTDYWTVAVQAASIPLKVPSQILLGTNAGSISGSETNQKDYYAEVGEKREKYMTRYIEEFCERFGIPMPEIDFETLFEETDTEKAEMLEKDMKSMSEGFTSGLIDQASAVEFLNEKYETEFKPGGGIPLTSPKTTDAAIYKPESLPQMKTKWEEPKYQRHLARIVQKSQDIFTQNLSFDSLNKALKGSIFFDLFRSKENIQKDAENEAKLIIDQQVSIIDTALKVYIADTVTKSWELGLVKASEDIFSKVLVSERQKQIRKAMSDSIMDKVTGATDSMKKDLRRVLLESMQNEESPRKAAKRFQEYVSEDFANTYKNRLKIIAEQETMDVLNEASYQAYEETDFVEEVQWITAGDHKVRPAHVKAHGEVVKKGKQFSLGVKRAPHGVGCRCDVIPYFRD